MKFVLFLLSTLFFATEASAKCVLPPSGKRSVSVELRPAILRTPDGHCSGFFRSEVWSVRQVGRSSFQHSGSYVVCLCVEGDPGQPSCLDGKEGGAPGSVDGLERDLTLKKLRNGPVDIGHESTQRIAREWTESFEGCRYRIAEIETVYKGQVVGRVHHLVDLKLTIGGNRPLPLFGNVERLSNWHK